MQIASFSLESLGSQINEAVIRMQFGASARIEFYEALSLLLENGVKLNDALNKLYDVASDDGKNTKNPKAIIYAHCIDGINEGKRLSVVLQKWVNYQEVSLIEAGEKSGDIKRTLDYAVRVIEKKQQIGGAVAMATFYPTILFGLACVLLNMVATKLVPKLARTTNPELWEGSARVLYLMSEFVTNYGKISLIAIAVLVGSILISLPYLRGPVRIYLDRVFPWSLYRMLHGSTFLLNIAVMVESGIKMRDALYTLASGAGPWLRERIEAALYGTGIGDNLGVSLANAGYNFPDKKAVRYLMVLANQDGFEQSIARFGERWMDESVKGVQKIAKLALGIGLLTIAVLMLLVIAGASGITDAIQAGVNR